MNANVQESTGKPRTAPAPFVVPAISFLTDYEPVERKAPGRTAEPNPFVETVAALVATWDDTIKRSRAGVALSFPKGDRSRVTAKFSKAANEAGYSPSYDDKADSKGNSNLVAYLVPKITRTRKDPVTETA